MRSDAMPAFHCADTGAAVLIRISTAWSAAGIQRLLHDRCVGMAGSLRGRLVHVKAERAECTY
jgi:hypothetical protein